MSEGPTTTPTIAANDSAESKADRLLDALHEAQTANNANVANNSVERAKRQANLAANSLANQPDDSEEMGSDFLIPAPVAKPEMFYGLLGEVAACAADGTEANPVAVMAAMMSWLSAAVGRNCVVAIGDTYVPLNLFTLHVGRTARARKGIALGLPKRIQAAIKQVRAFPPLAPEVYSGGISTPEGLAGLIHDGYEERGKEVPAVLDKRLWGVEEEFATLLMRAKREGNLLSPCLRSLWDGGDIKPATKGPRIGVTDPHVALHGSITKAELLACLTGRDMANGFANRFLMFWAEKTGVVPFPKSTAPEIVENFAQRFGEVIRFSLVGYPQHRELCVLTMSSGAKALFERAYKQFDEPHPAGDLITGLLERRAPMARIVAGIFALTDMKTEIDQQHMTAALAWMDYFAQSVHMIFGGLGNPEASERRRRHADQLLQWLRHEDGWRTRTTIIKACFKNHITSADLDAALETLLTNGTIQRREVPNPGRRAATEYRTSASPKQSDGSGRGGSPIGSHRGSAGPADDSQIRNLRIGDGQATNGGCIEQQRAQQQSGLDDGVLQQMLSNELMTLKVSNGQLYFADLSGKILRNPSPSAHLNDYVFEHNEQIVSMLAPREFHQ